MQCIPEWAPSGENHILYSDRKVQYTAMQNTRAEYLRLAFKPLKITVNGIKISLYSGTSKEGYILKDLGNGGYAIKRVWFDHAYNNVWIYNNIFRIVDQIDSWPEYIRLYAGPGKILSINNLKIFNNLFVDNSNMYLPIRIMGYGAKPTGSGNEIKNNILYNMGTDSSTPVIHIEESSGWTSDSWTFSNNIYYGASGLPYIFFRERSYTIPQWKSRNEPSVITKPPKFLSYVANALNNDFHLTAGDTLARDKGLNLSSYFTTDKGLIIRPQGSAWDIGPYKYVSPAG